MIEGWIALDDVPEPELPDWARRGEGDRVVLGDGGLAHVRGGRGSVARWSEVLGVAEVARRRPRAGAATSASPSVVRGHRGDWSGDPDAQSRVGRSWLVVAAPDGSSIGAIDGAWFGAPLPLIVAVANAYRARA